MLGFAFALAMSGADFAAGSAGSSKRAGFVVAKYSEAALVDLD